MSGEILNWSYILIPEIELIINSEQLKAVCNLVN